MTPPPTLEGDVPTLVSVLRHRYLRGWPKHAQGEHVSLTPLEVALTQNYASDAHLVMYASPNARRLTRDAVEHGVRVVLQSAMLDLDCLEVHGTDQPAPDSWREATLERFERLLRVHPDLFLYMTRGGARIVGRVHPPMVIASREDARDWASKCAVAHAYLRRRFGLICDPQCVSWNWLFRLPRVRRDGQLEQWPMYGDPSRIGVLQIDEDPCDIEAARRANRALFDQPTGRARAHSHAAATGAQVIGGRGLLYELLSARGAIVREHTSQPAFVIRCPREHLHSVGRAGDGSTLLYEPDRGDVLGWIHCLHSHCSGLHVRDWLRCFTESELDAARVRAGIARVAS